MTRATHTWPSVPVAPAGSLDEWRPATIRLLDVLCEAGFLSELRPVQGGALVCVCCGVQLRPEDAREVRLHRGEGGSDPGDGMLIVGLRWPGDAHPSGGRVVLGYGPTASAADLAVLERLPDAG